MLTSQSTPYRSLSIPKLLTCWVVGSPGMWDGWSAPIRTTVSDTVRVECMTQSTSFSATPVAVPPMSATVITSSWPPRTER